MRPAQIPIAIVAVLTLSTASCKSVDLTKAEYPSQSFYFVDKSNQRQTNPEKYFSHEYAYIHHRNGIDSNIRPKTLTGLALSGGGMRSAAFQLGLLSGLHDTKINNRNALATIDYISSVSGGSWANGGYWSSRHSDGDFFSCLDAYAADGKSNQECAPPTRALRSTQNISIVPTNGKELVQRKIMWEADIVQEYLPDCNVRFDDPKPEKWKDCIRGSSSRPYPIFNSTHSSSDESASAENFPFESTPDFQGTLIDNSPNRGFFVSSHAKDFQWQLRKWQRYFALKAENRQDLPGPVLSLILAHSSGVVGSSKPMLLQYNFHAHFQDSAIAGIQRTYHLADGGKSENLGVLPLLERGVNTIVVSQMGKEGQDFGDVRLASQQAKRLFGCEFRADWNRNIELVESTSYSCPDGNGGTRTGLMIMIRPTTANVSAFIDYLRNHNPVLLDAMEAADRKESETDRFPETPTFRTSYPPEIARAYYLLGKYVASGPLAVRLSGLTN